MSYIVRTWKCQNQRCGCEFESGEKVAVCPACGNVRVEWVPKGGNLMGLAREADAELRKLADTFGLSDINSARRGERSKPALPVPSVADTRPAMQFAPGFSGTPYVVGKDGRPHAVCEPSRNRVDFKTRVGTNTPLAPSSTFKHISSATRIEARHSGK